MGIDYQLLLQEELAMKKLAEHLKARSEKYPGGILEISHKNGNSQYYVRDACEAGKRRKRKYIKKKDMGIAASLAQRDYELKLYEDLSIRIKAIETARKAFEKTSPETVALRFTKERQHLIRPLVLSDEQFAEKWLLEEHEKKAFQENTPEFFTAKGERVRSKSEKIIADSLFRSGIPYKYEPPLILKGFGLVHPDFLVLNKKTRKEYYWEHLGMMDDEQYVRNAIQKIHAYEKNNILPGLELILSSETKIRPLDVNVLDNIIKRFFL